MVAARVPIGAVDEALTRRGASVSKPPRSMASRALSIALDDSLRARRVVAAVLYAVFVPLAVVVELAGGAGRAHPAQFWAVTAFLAAQLLITLTVELNDRVALFLVVAVPASYLSYAAVALPPTESLWPCLVLPVVWCSLFLPPRMASLSVLLNSLAGASGAVLPADVQPSAAVVSIRAGTLIVASLVIVGLVSQIRASRDRYHAATNTLQGTLAAGELPELPGVELAVAYRPLAAADIQVGGDFYDVFPCPGGWYAIAVGDVEGKGLEAAAVTGLVRHELRTRLYLGERPAQALAHLNRRLHDHAANRFCTLAVALLRPHADGYDVRLARAGHPAPVIVQGRNATELDAGLGPVLGFDSKAAYTESSARLQLGDQLILYTDGVTEARRGHDEYGVSRLVSALGSAAARPPDAICESLVRSVSSFADAITDDVTLVVVRTRE